MEGDILTPSDRISELNTINAEFATLLEHAGRAIQALSPNAGVGADNAEARRDTFEQSSSSFFRALQAGTAKLKRQAYALEEAGIITAEPTITTISEPQKQPAGKPGQPVPPILQPERITNNGLGNLDLGWLNSRGNKVGAEKEAELMEEAKKLFESELAKAKD